LKEFNEFLPKSTLRLTEDLPFLSKTVNEVNFEARQRETASQQEYKPMSWLKSTWTSAKNDSFIGATTTQLLNDIAAYDEDDHQEISIPKNMNFQQYQINFPQYFGGVREDGKDIAYIADAFTHEEALARRKLLLQKYEDDKYKGQNGIFHQMTSGLLGTAVADLPVSFAFGSVNVLGSFSKYNAANNVHKRINNAMAVGTEVAVTEMMLSNVVAGYQTDIATSIGSSMLAGFILTGKNKEVVNNPVNNVDVVKQKKDAQKSKYEKNKEDLDYYDNKKDSKEIVDEDLTPEIKNEINKKSNIVEKTEKEEFVKKDLQQNEDLSKVKEEFSVDQDSFEELQIKKLEIENELADLPKDSVNKFATLKLNQLDSKIKEKELAIKKAESIFKEETLNKKDLGMYDGKRKEAARKKLSRSRKDLEILKNRKIIKELDNKLNINNKKFDVKKGKVFIKAQEMEFTLQNVDNLANKAESDYNRLALEFQTLKTMQDQNLKVSDVYNEFDFKIKENQRLAKKAEDDIIVLREEHAMLSKELDDIKAKNTKKRNDNGCN
jgi:hypothetical protein